MVADDFAVGVAAVFHHDAHAGAAALVAQFGDAVDLLFLDQVGDALDEHALVDGIGDLGDDDASVLVLDAATRPHQHTAVPRLIGLTDAVRPVDDAVGREVRPLDVLHQFGRRTFGMMDAVDRTVHDLAQVVGRDVGGHTDGDTDRAVEQDVGKAGGKHRRLLAGVIEVADERHDVLFNVGHHHIGHLGHSRLGITVGGRAVAVDVTEVAVAFDQRIPQRERLCHTHHGHVDRAVAVRMVAAQHVTDGGGGFAEGFVIGQMILVHGVEDAALTGFHTVPHVRQGAGGDDAHGVFDKGLPDLFLHVAPDDLLFGKFDTAVFVFLIHFSSLRQISRLVAYLAFCSINSRRGSTSSPMQSEKTSSQRRASLISTFSRVR